MNSRINIEEAKRMVQESENRESVLIEEVNRLIRFNAKVGVNYTFIPQSFTNSEQELIEQRLKESGYKVTGSKIEW